MDRRMYRSNMRNSNYRCDREVSPYKASDPVCDDMSGGFSPDVSCERETDFYDEAFDSSRFPIGMCYVPWQRFRNLYENEFEAIARGTIFKELYKEWCGRGCR